MTAEDIIKAVAENIYFSYGGDIPIYTETVKQGFKTPCFFITGNGADVMAYLGGRYYEKWSITVEYYYGDDNRTEPKGLFENLEFITADGRVLRGTGASLKNDREKLSLNISYGAFFIKEETGAPYMAALIEKGKGR